MALFAFFKGALGGPRGMKKTSKNTVFLGFFNIGSPKGPPKDPPEGHQRDTLTPRGGPRGLKGFTGSPEGPKKDPRRTKNDRRRRKTTEDDTRTKPKTKPKTTTTKDPNGAYE